MTWRANDRRSYRLVAINHSRGGSSRPVIIKFVPLEARPPSESNDTLAAAGHGLSQRQAEVFALLARGLTDSEIGRALNISYDTARAHVRTIFRKLNVSSRIEAVNAIRGD